MSAARVFPFKPGDRGAAATEKNLTSILLHASDTSIVGFGREARRRFFEMDPDEQRSYMYLEQFKMVMAPSRRGKAPLSERKVHALGVDMAVPLLLATSKVLEAVKVEAEDRLLNLGVSPEKIGWCITVPAIWDDEAKAFMRAAAEAAGIKGEALSLCLEPEGAVIAAMCEATAEVQHRLSVGAGVMILDCGGGTVDVTVSRVTGKEPYSLQEILPASGDAWGGTLVDAEYRKFCNTVLCPPGSDGAGTGRADPSALAAMMDAWETAKVGWDPADAGRAVVKVGGLAGVCEAAGGPEAMLARVAAFNVANDMDGPDAVVYKPRAFALWLPSSLVRSFFDQCVTNITAHMLELCTDAEDAGHPVNFVFLVGGFAESVYLQRSVRAALKLDPSGPPLAELIVPNKPVQSVNRGSALWALYPKVITARISRYTYLVDLAELYDPSLHDPLPHKRYLEEGSGGRYAKHVLVPLVQRGDEIPTDASVQREVCAMRHSQTNVSFDLYKLDCRVPTLDSRLRRVFVFEADLPQPPPESLKLSLGSENYVGAAVSHLKTGLTKLVQSTGGAVWRKRKQQMLRATGDGGPGSGELEPGELAHLGLPEYLPVVRTTDRLATVMVDIGQLPTGSGGGGGVKDTRSATLSLFFGKTEITAVARAASSGDKREVSIKYQG